MNALRALFRLLNKYFMVPVFNLGLGPFVGNPISGYIMVLKTIGRKSGVVRYAPVNYAILDGHIYILSGFGKLAHWYKNLVANPDVEMIMPSATLSGKAATVVDDKEWLRTTRQILKNGGFAGLLAGYNAFTMSDEVLRDKGKEMIVIRIKPHEIFNGAADPGGWLWVWLTVVLIVVLIIIF